MLSVTTQMKQHLPDQSAECTAQVIYVQIFDRWGCTEQLHSDRGAQFLSTVVQSLCHIMGTNNIQTSPLHPAGNGLGERINPTLARITSHQPDT